MSYSGGLLGYTGCGPTNLAMVVLYLTGDKTVTPASVAEYAESAGYSVPGSGSSWTLISEVVNIMGFMLRKCRWMRTE